MNTKSNLSGSDISKYFDRTLACHSRILMDSWGLKNRMNQHAFNMICISKGCTEIITKYIYVL